MPQYTNTPRIGARVLLLDSADRVLLIHALDPADPEHHWWELPGGGQDHGETLPETARRELAEESGITDATLDRKLWIRESRFHYKKREHHRIDHVFLARTSNPAPQTVLKLTDNEKAGIIERRWWTATELQHCTDKLLPATLPHLLTELLAGRLPVNPLTITDE
ncbi:NUDIX hydrolase [Amycolatopsis magusensis]|uniref:ADP-ribose pyrophosphatase YjhB (NUDIX family) n=1 Tax=Amycolatopsis magusensis TaxID=882444 RepID=A0ABS4PWK1_9PSEU|nr:NUDIX domain-containing protein [Amycolatopsis magusensis]MBP2183811.1 ADP-ribose pyrophosphatase YjhB (NUDIX family) [Amycolatopsis magusensis]